MELVNLVVIITMVSVCISWAFRKKKEIESTTIDFESDHNHLGEEDRDAIELDRKSLANVGQVFEDIIKVMLRKIVNISVLVFLGMSVVVWVSVFQIFRKMKISVFNFLAFFGGKNISVGIGHFFLYWRLWVDLRGSVHLQEPQYVRFEDNHVLQTLKMAVF